jgi:hypothetical protein
VEAPIGLDDTAVVLRLRAVADRHAPSQQVGSIDRRIQEHAIPVLTHDTQALAQVLVDLVPDARNRHDLVWQRARQQAEPLGVERPAIQHLRVRRAGEVRREQLRDPGAHELQRGRGLGGAEVGVERLPRIEPERHHVAPDGQRHGFEGCVERQPDAPLVVDDGTAVVGVRHERLREHAMEPHGGGSGRARNGLVGDAGARQHEQRLRHVGGAGHGGQDSCRHLDHGAHVARGHALRAQHLDQDAGGVGVVAAPLAEGLERALHPPVVELGTDGVPDPLVDLDRSGEPVGGLAERRRHRADRRLQAQAPLRLTGSRGRQRRRRDPRHAHAWASAHRRRSGRELDARVELRGLLEHRGRGRALGRPGLAQQRDEPPLTRFVCREGLRDATGRATRGGHLRRAGKARAVRGVRPLQPRERSAERVLRLGGPSLPQGVPAFLQRPGQGALVQRPRLGRHGERDRERGESSAPRTPDRRATSREAHSARLLERHRTRQRADVHDRANARHAALAERDDDRRA